MLLFYIALCFVRAPSIADAAIVSSIVALIVFIMKEPPTAPPVPIEMEKLLRDVEMARARRDLELLKIDTVRAATVKKTPDQFVF